MYFGVHKTRGQHQQQEHIEVRAGQEDHVQRGWGSESTRRNSFTRKVEYAGKLCGDGLTDLNTIVSLESMVFPVVCPCGY
jgi:hypothetical protein